MMMMTGAPMTNPPTPESDLQALDSCLTTLNQWLTEVPETSSDLRLKITDRILKAIDLRRKMAAPKGKGGKFGKMGAGR